MQGLNKVILIGRLTRDPQILSFGDGGRSAVFCMVVNNRKKNKDTGAWEEDPCFVECKANNREKRKLADVVEQYLHKGSLICMEGHLVLDRWTGKEDGKPRQQLRVMVDDVSFLESKKDIEDKKMRNTYVSNFDGSGPIGPAGPGFDDGAMPF